jgi:diguanylate cyclase (GGDEF)-like protein
MQLARFAAWILLAGWVAGPAVAMAPAVQHDDVSQLLKLADSLKTSQHAEFQVLMHRLEGSSVAFSAQQKLYLRFLEAWQAAYEGDYDKATSLLTAVMDGSSDPTLRFRADASAVNMLGISAHYEQAFERLSHMLDDLPNVVDKAARIQGLGEAAQLYVEAGQYDLAADYADQLLKESVQAGDACKGRYLIIQILAKHDRLQPGDAQMGIDACVMAGEPLFANGIRTNLASFYIQKGRSAAAIKLLQANYADVKHEGYRVLTSQFDALLAEAYWKAGDVDLATQFARKAADGSIPGEYTEPLTMAYRLLYLIAQKQGDFPAALGFHLKYMDAYTGYLNAVSAWALAYQTVKQHLLARKLQVYQLGKQNKILSLQAKLDRKAMETTRLYIMLLVAMLAFIVFLAYWLRRSQLGFMKLARRDGLTGIFNRQHFVEESQLRLANCQKLGRDACIILIDLDHFKQVNDTHGHSMGDQVLKRAVAACQQYLRDTDVFGRLGGEEFAILLPACSLEQVTRRVELLRLAISAAPDGETQSIAVSASFGVATSAGSGYALRQLLIHADDALYQAKNSGRNRAIIFDAMEGMRHQQAMRQARHAAVGEPTAAPTH